jgi:hypothetical protein
MPAHLGLDHKKPTNTPANAHADADAHANPVAQAPAADSTIVG